MGVQGGLNATPGACSDSMHISFGWVASFPVPAWDHPHAVLSI